MFSYTIAVTAAASEQSPTDRSPGAVKCNPRGCQLQFSFHSCYKAVPGNPVEEKWRGNSSKVASVNAIFSKHVRFFNRE